MIGTYSLTCKIEIGEYPFKIQFGFQEHNSRLEIVYKH